MKHIIPINSFTRKLKKLRFFYYTYSFKLNPNTRYKIVVDSDEYLIENQSSYSLTVKEPKNIELVVIDLKDDIKNVLNINVNYFFDKIFIINLPQHTKRREITENRLISQGIWNYEFIEGVDGKELEDGEISRFELGCLLSHKRIVEESRQREYTKVLVFEDDIIFHNQFHKLVSILLSRESDIWYLGCSQVPNTLDTIQVLDEHIYRSNRCNGTYAFGYTSNVFSSIINFGETKPIDVQLHEIQDRSIVVYPNAVISDVSESYIRGERDMNIYSELVCWKLEDYLFDIV